MGANRDWLVWLTSDGSTWIAEDPYGRMTEFSVGSLAIELGTKLARENGGRLLVFNRAGALETIEDFRFTDG